MRFQNKSLSRQNYDIHFDLTPIIDILFILIVFFMLTIGSNIQSLTVDIPSNEHKETQFQDNENFKILLEVRGEQYFINQMPMRDLNEAKNKISELTQLHSKYRLLIAPQKDAIVQPFIDILTFLSAEKIKSEVLMEPKDEN